MKKLSIILLIACCMISCRKFLEEYSPSEVTPRSTSDFGEILIVDGYPDPIQLLHFWTVFLDDDTQCYVGVANQETAPAQLAQIKNVYQWQSVLTNNTEYTIAPNQINAWANYYKLLLGVNVVLQNIDKATGSLEEKDQIKGEAFGLRAMYHFMLVNLYARPYNDSLTTPEQSPGIPLRLNANLSDAYLTRHTVKEVYQQIVSDLDSSLILLNRKKNESNGLRLTHVAVHLLASRVHLYMEEWQKSIEHADAVLQYHPQLMDYRDWVTNPPSEDHQLIGPNNPESIFSYGNYQEQYPFMYTGYTFSFSISKDLYNSYEENDLRKSVIFTFVPEEYREYFAVEIMQQKHTYISSSSGPSTINNSWRSAEAYLNRAEAYIQLYRSRGDGAAATEALKSLNALRAKRFDPSTFQPWTPQPGNTLLHMCREERRRELFREETHRWFDLRRYGMPEIRHNYIPEIGTVQFYTLKKRDLQYVIPIPEDVHSRNPALTRNPSIPGTRQPD